MKLPNFEMAEVPEAKVVSYLLSLEHRDGRGKALFFLKFGFSVRQWRVLAEAFKQHAVANDVSSIE